MMQDVAAAMMAEFAGRLEAELGRPKGEPDQRAAVDGEKPGGADRPASEVPSAEEAFDLGGALVDARIVRYGGVAAVLLMIAAAILILLRGRRRQLTVNINLSR